jgi:hypothetical protein
VPSPRRKLIGNSSFDATFFVPLGRSPLPTHELLRLSKFAHTHSV